MKKNLILPFLFLLLFASNLYSANGLTGQYYDDHQNYTSYQYTHVDPTIDFNWGYGSPNGLGADTFSIKWSGYIYIPETANYTFYVAHDDFMSVTIDGTQYYSNGNWTGGSNNYNTFSINNLAVGYHPIEIDYYEGYGGAYAKFGWKNNASITSQTIVPTSNLFTEIPSSSISIADQSITEGNSGTKMVSVPVTLSYASTNQISVDYQTADGTATSGSDYNETNGTLIFPAGVTTQNIEVPIIGDTNIENDKNFTITLSNPQNASINKANATVTIVNDDFAPTYCSDNNLSDGFHVIDPFNDVNKSIEIFCYNKRDFIALPNKNTFNNFVFKSDSLTSNDYYTQAQNNSTQFNAIEINANTMEVITNPTQRDPRNISNFTIMGSSFSNINLIGTPFAVDWANSQISNCTTSKLRKGYHDQAVKINTLDYDSKAICNIDKMKIKLLDDYRYLLYKINPTDKGSEVLQPTCKLMAEAVPSSWLSSESIKGHYWIMPNKHDRSFDANDITQASQRPIVAYCWYQTDLHWAWTFLLDLDGKRTISKSDLVSKSDSCSALGLFPFVPNNESTFERVRKFLADNKSQWSNYTGTIQEKVHALYGDNYYLSTEQSQLIWPYGSFGVYYPYDGGHDASGQAKTWGGSNNSTPGWMSGSPMHNIPTITTDYPRYNNDRGDPNRDYYSYGHYSSTDTDTDPSTYHYTDTMGYKGWVSILGSADLNKTNSWFISRTGSGDNFDITGNYPYYEPNGNYTAGAWLNYLFDDQGRVRHADDWTDHYPYYDYMCMAEDNYDFTTRYGLINGPFKVIEHNVAAGAELTNTALKTKIVNDTLKFDVILLTNDLSAIQPDKNVSAGIFLDTTKMVGTTETPEDIIYFGQVSDFNTSSGRFELPASKWPGGVQKLTKAYPRLFFKFKFCTRDDMKWTQCWNSGLNGSTISPYAQDADSDDFAVRPDRFNFSITGATSPLKAGQNYTATFSALDKLGQPTDNYNETVTVDYNETNPNCLRGDFIPALSSATMSNGTVNYPTLSYNNVGKVYIKMAEEVGSEFAKVDASDTPASQRLITPYDQNWSFTPDHFDINASLVNGGNNFTYISKDLNMSLNLDLNVTAKGAGNINTTNYNTICYAKDTSYNISYDNLVIAPSNSLSLVKYKERTSSTDGNSSINTNVILNNIPKTVFSVDHNGSASLKFAINFDRNQTKVVNPFKLNIRDINVSDTDNVSGLLDFNTSGTFYYGRVHAPDYRFNNDNGDATIYYEVYSTQDKATRNSFGLMGTEAVNSIDWYSNTLQTSATFGDYNKSAPTAKSGTTPTVTDFETLHLVAPNTPHKDKITLTPSTWLVYNSADPSATTTDFLVEFYKNGQWSGQGNVGKTVDLNISQIQNHRIDW